MNNVWRSRGAGALIVLLTVVAYLPALRGGFIWDDDFYVTDYHALRSLEGLGRIWSQPGMEAHQYYPLSFTGLWMQYHLWNRHPFGYHLVNILLHAVNAVLLWGVLRRLAVPGSWWAAALFALHPVQVESVAWITEFKNVTSATFSLLAVLAFLRCRPLSASETSGTRDGRFSALAILLFVCALLCKTAVCCLPVVIAVLLWWKLERIPKRDVLALIPWFAASLALGLITMRVESRLPDAGPTGGAMSLIHRGLLAGRALWFYAGKVFWPHPLTFVYPRWNVEVVTAWQYLFPLAAVAVLLGLWLLRRWMGKGPLAGVLCFTAMLLPVLGFFNIFFFRYSYVTDHFQYLACIGLMALAASAGTTIAHRLGQRGHNLATLAGGGILLLLGASTWKQTHIYQNTETLWRDTLARNPSAWIAHNNLGMLLQERGELTEAAAHYEQVLRMKPDFAESHNNLGVIRMQQGQLQEAIGHYQQALLLEPGNAKTHYNLGLTLWLAGEVQPAVEHWERALQIDPNYADAHNNLGGALLRLGRVPEAIQHFEQALRIRTDMVEAHYNLAIALEQSGKTEEAIKHYRQVLRLKPDSTEAQNRLDRLRAAR